jgi:hypothetical protein
MWHTKKDLVREQQVILQENPNKRRQMRNANVGRRRGRKPRQQMSNNGTPTLEEADHGDTESQKSDGRSPSSLHDEDQENSDYSSVEIGDKEETDETTVTEVSSGTEEEYTSESSSE